MFNKATWFVKENFEAIKCKSLPEEAKTAFSYAKGSLCCKSLGIAFCFIIGVECANIFTKPSKRTAESN